MNIIDLEVAFINLLQKIDYKYVVYILKLSKLLTKNRIYLLSILLYDYVVCINTIISYYMARILVTLIKNVCKQERPYNKHQDKIKYFKKQKSSYCYPSQSVVSTCIIYYNLRGVVNSIYLDYYFYMLLTLLTFTRSYRGLHYLHDILSSVILSKLVYTFSHFTITYMWVRLLIGYK